MFAITVTYETISPSTMLYRPSFGWLAFEHFLGDIVKGYKVNAAYQPEGKIGHFQASYSPSQGLEMRADTYAKDGL